MNKDDNVNLKMEIKIKANMNKDDNVNLKMEIEVR